MPDRAGGLFTIVKNVPTAPRTERSENDTNNVAKLYLVPTPVGNMDDMSPRAVETLRRADLVVAEDTRTSGKLMRHFGIDTPMQSHHMFNEHRTADRIVEKILAGQNVALITDAGTPGISDPGFLLARQAIRQGVQVECLPGPTAFVPALAASGLPCERFVFEGFLPVKKGRATRLEELRGETRTMVFYEAPHKLLRTLEDLSAAFGPDRQACASREISKVFEEHVRGTLCEVAAHFSSRPPKGEFVLVVQGAGAAAKEEKRKKINKDEQKVATQTPAIGSTNGRAGRPAESGPGVGPLAGTTGDSDL